MKAVNRISAALKVAGIVLILLSLVLGLYALLNTGSAWNTLNEGLNRTGVSTGMLDKLAFDDRYLSALSKSFDLRDRDREERNAAAEPYFDRWFAAMDKAVVDAGHQQRSDLLNWLNNEFDAAAYQEKLDAMEGLQESQELREIFEYVDGLAAPPKKGKIASLQVASQEPFFREFYENYASEHGEEAGTWFEFMSAVSSMLRSQETPVRDVKGFMTGTFTPEAYAAELEKVRAEEKQESTDSFLNLMEEALNRKARGEDPDYAGMLDQVEQVLAERYPNRNLGGSMTMEGAIASVFRDMIANEAFDGSWGAVADALQQRALADVSEGVTAWKEKYLDSVTEEADKRSSIPVISPVWQVTAKYFTILLIGILLLILSRFLKWALNRRLLATRDTAGIEEDPDVLLRVEHLKQYFRGGGGVTKAVDDISFYIKKGEVFGLVGESGCGKTTTGRTIINLYDPTEGNVYFDGLKISSTKNGLPVLKAQLKQDYGIRIADAKKRGAGDEVRALKAELKEKLNEAEKNALESFVEKSKCVTYYREKRQAELKKAYDEDMKTLSGAAAEERTKKYETEKAVAARDNVMTRMQMIFQDPIASINPRMTVREIIAEGLIIRGVKDKKYIDEKVNEMLELVGLVREHADRYPHEFSGGQRQRIGIARAIIMEPDLIIADEPISALDVSIQAQVINLLNELRERMGLTIMFIAHNLSVVKYFSDRIAVMYFGHIVELATSDELFAHPLHPYTKSLLSAIPYPDPHYEKNRKRIEYVPAKAHDYSTDKPSLREIVPGHFIHCNEEEYQRYLKELAQ